MATTAGAEPHIPMSKGRKNATTKKAEQKIEQPAVQLAPTMEHKETPKEAPATEFVWPWGGEKVEVAGSWSNWTPVPMIYDQITRTHRVWVPNMPRGRISYKFIMDGEWRYDGHKPTTRDEFGNVNNVIEL